MPLFDNSGRDALSRSTCTREDGGALAAYVMADLRGPSLGGCEPFDDEDEEDDVDDGREQQQQQQQKPQQKQPSMPGPAAFATQHRSMYAWDGYGMGADSIDCDGRLRLANHAGQLLLGKPAERILGREAAEIGLGECLTGEPARLLTTTFASGGGRWGMRRSLFREGGRPHHLIVIGDLSRTLREEETRAWQRLVRVLGHELNNSLAPIKSLAGSLASLLRRAPRPSDWEDDMRSGLDIIENRADGLSRFMQAYARLARLPVPTLAHCEVPALVQRVTALEARLPVTVLGGPPLEVSCDAAQIEQVLINLLKNAVEAAQETDGGVRIAWKRTATHAEISVEDDGPGLANTANLFVPFFTTKSEGSGIGLVLCRQIAENHRGSLTLTNREGASGCVALLKLPV